MCNVEQNFMTMNKNYLGKYLNNNKIQNEADDLKCNFLSYEAIFSKSTNRAKVATIASCKIAESFPKQRKCEGGSDAEKSLVVATDLLLMNSKIKLNMKCN